MKKKSKYSSYRPITKSESKLVRKTNTEFLKYNNNGKTKPNKRKMTEITYWPFKLLKKKRRGGLHLMIL